MFKKIDLKITDENHPLYVEGKIFTEYLSTHSRDLEHYKIIKEECNGLPIKEYQRRKIEFTNEILEKAKLKLIT